MTVSSRTLPRAGEELPPLEVPVTRTLIVSGAVASRDFQDVHHDAEAAREKGSPDIFMNILTTNGLVGRYVTEWAGPDARLHKVAIRLGAPNHPGDTMTLTGRVTAVHASAGPAEHGSAVSEGAHRSAVPAEHGKDTGGATVEVAVRGANALGNHVTGTVVVTLRRQEPALPRQEPAPQEGADS